MSGRMFCHERLQLAGRRRIQRRVFVLGQQLHGGVMLVTKHEYIL